MAENLEVAHCKTLAIAFSDVEVEVETELLVNTLADRLAEVEAVTLSKTLDNVKVV